MKKSGIRKIGILTTMIVVFAGSVIFIYSRYFGKTSFTGKDKSIAVLPFINLSANPVNEYFSDGMTDEIISQLSKISGLRVVSRGSVTRFKGSKKDIRAIADELHVAAILEGGVEKSGDKLKINARLIDANTGWMIWEDKFDRDITDIFSVQTEVAQLIANKLNTELTNSEKNNISRRPTQNLEAYDQYLQGQFCWYKGGETMLRKGIDYFNRAILLDPQYSRAYSGLADCYSALGYNSYELPATAFLKAELAANKALLLDSTLADPHTSLGYIKFYYYWDWAGAEDEFLKAIRLNPVYVLAYDSYGYYLTAMERFPEARAALEKAVQLDPLAAKINTDLGFNLYYERIYDQAITILKSSLELNPKLPLTHIWLGRCYQEKKMYKETIREYQQALISDKTWPVSLAAIGYVYGVSGQIKEARKILDTMITISDSRYVTPYGLALVYTGLNERENAFRCLDVAYTQRSNWLVWLKLDPRWAPLSNDKRYAALIGKIGLHQTARPFSKE